MTRISKDPEVRRQELISQASILFNSRGYANTSVHDIVDQVGVAKGTFYHYFSSKQEVLEAIVDNYLSKSLKLIRSIVNDQNLTALQKWVRAFQEVNNWKLVHREEMLYLLQMLLKKENLLLMHILETRSIEAVSPEFEKIIRQGHREKVFDVDNPELSVAITFSIARSIHTRIYRVLQHPDRYCDPAETVWETFLSIQKAIERVLKAPQGSLPLIDKKTIQAWFC